MSGAQATSTPSRQGITPVGKPRSVEKRRLLVVSAVAVSVFQKPDDAAGFAFAVDTQRVVAHLDDPELAVGPPLEGDRVFDQGLGGGQLDLETGRDLDRLERFLGRFARRLGGDGRPVDSSGRADRPRRQETRGDTAWRSFLPLGAALPTGAGRGSPDPAHQAGRFPACWQGASGDTI